MANVPVIISRAILTRQGASPILPGASEDPAQPINPDGTGNIPPVDGSYADQATMIADQANQLAQYIYFDGTNYWEYLGTTVGTIADYREISGGGSKWSDLPTSGIYYNSAPVVIGNDSDFTGLGATLRVRSRYNANNTTVATENFFELRDANDRLKMNVTNGTFDGGVSSFLEFPAVGITIGAATRLVAGLSFRGTNSTDAVSIFRITNNDNATIMEIRGGGRTIFPDTSIFGFQVGTGAGTNFTFSGIHVSARGTGATNNILRAASNGGVTRFQVINNGNIDMPSLPTADPLVAGRLWRDVNDLKISTG
jgi:hypothetical protein